MTVLLTRTIKDSTELANQIEACGIDVCIESMFSTEYLDCDFDYSDLSSVQGVIFTSKNALYAIRSNVHNLAHLKCFVIGNATAKMAKKMKFNNIYVANNSAKSLLELVLSNSTCSGGDLLYSCGELITLDFKAELEKLCYNVQKLCVYRTVDLKAFSKELKDKMINNQIRVMLLYSCNTAEIFLSLIEKNHMVDCLSAIDLFVISRKVRQIIKKYKWKSVTIFDVDQQEKIIEKIRRCYE
jgi:uroporphyrinogen-III synthase